MKLRKLLLAGIIAICALGVQGCGGNDSDESKETTTKEEQQVDVDIKDIVQAVKDAYGEDYVPNTTLDQVFVEETLGISMDDCEEVVAEGPLVSFFIDTFIGIKAKDGKGDAIEEKLNAYRDYLVNDSMMYPTNAVKIQASKVVRHGDYVFFTCLGQIDTETEDQGDDAILTQAKEKNQIAVDTINNFFK